MKVAVVGASGFVGSALVESFWNDGNAEVLPLAHSSGNAWQLARHGRPISFTNILSDSDLSKALQGCTHVVNCSRGNREVMTTGLKNLLAAARRVGVRRFVHLSSVAVYGYRFHGGLIDEDCANRAPTNSYGGLKELGDRLCKKACRSGLPCVIICPPNITGPNSPFLLSVVDSISNGKCALVQGDARPCEFVDVKNLVHAIRLALHCEHATAQRIFVTDGSGLTWKRALQEMAQFIGRDDLLRQIDAATAQRSVEEAKPPSPNLRDALKRLVSSDVRKALAADPMWKSMLEGAAKTIKKVAPSVEARLKDATSKTGLRIKQSTATPISLPLIDQQLRNARYSIDRAKLVLGYEPIVDYQTSRDAFQSWFDAQFGRDSEFSDLYAALS